MKTYILFFTSLLAFFMLSCGGDEPTDEPQEEVLTEEEIADMEQFSFKDYGINMQILLPSVESKTGSSVKPYVTHDDGDYLWYLDIGKHFHMVIEDFGSSKTKIEDEKARLEDESKIFVVEYYEDTPNLIFYKRSLHDDQGGKPSYHVYGQTEIDGINYVLRSADEGGMKPVIEDMVKTVKSAKPIEEA